MSGDKKNVIIYNTVDGKASVSLYARDGVAWMNQNQIAELFDTSKQNIGQHIANILKEGELPENSVVKNYFTTAADGKQYNVAFYALDMVLAIGFRARSKRGTQFRVWANRNLKEYMVKGFVMDDDRLKNPDGRPDYFDEWLERIRDIRASEKRFYQKIRDIYSTAIDYDKDSAQAQSFFKKVQNKMLWAITGKTAAELIESRSNPDAPNMGLTSWRGSIVRKQDVAIAKNYLNADEIKNLNEIVTMYLDYAERQARQRKTVTMEQWAAKLDAFLEFNEQELLSHAGKVKAEVAKNIAEERYEEFDGSRKISEALTADEEDLKELEDMEKRLLKDKTANKSKKNNDE